MVPLEISRSRIPINIDSPLRDYTLFSTMGPLFLENVRQNFALTPLYNMIHISYWPRVRCCNISMPNPWKSKSKEINVSKLSSEPSFPCQEIFTLLQARSWWGARGGSPPLRSQKLENSFKFVRILAKFLTSPPSESLSWDSSFVTALLLSLCLLVGF